MLVCSVKTELLHLRYEKRSIEGRRAGTHLAGGFYGVLWAIMGDLEYMCNELDLPRFSSGTNPCALCKCTGVGPLTWTDNRPIAPWLSSCWSAAAWRLWPGRSKNPLFDLPGVTALTVCLDYMHAKYLGFDQYVFGSVLYLVVFYIMSGGVDPQANLNRVWQMIQKYYRDNNTPCRYQYLNKITMFKRKSGFPKLRGKAGEIKYLGAALLDVFEQVMNPVLGIHKKIKLMLKLNVKMESILCDYREDFALPGEAAAQFKEAAFGLVQLQTQIAEHFIDSDVRLFDITSKTHMMLHCALIAKHLNPRVVWCFTGEDMMKHSQLLAKSCVKGTPNQAASVKMAQHYRVGLDLKFQKHFV